MLLGKLLKTTLITLAVVLSLASIGVALSSFALFTGALFQQQGIRISYPKPDLYLNSTPQAGHLEES